LDMTAAALLDFFWLLCLPVRRYSVFKDQLLDEKVHF